MSLERWIRLPLIMLVSSIVLASGVPTIPGSEARATAVKANGILEEIDGQRMMTSVMDLEGFHSRAFYLSSAANAGAYIYDRFVELGLWVEYQSLIVNGYTVRNVIGVLNGTDPEAPQYLFGAHYDSANLNVENYSDGDKFAAPGADDDASGVAATIELATVLHNKHFESTIKFVAFAAEESGLNGSFSFVVRENERGVEYADTVIMDMIGYSRDNKSRAVMFADKASNTMLGAVRTAVVEYNLDLSLTTLSGILLDTSDHFPFWLAGYPSLFVIEELVDGMPVNPNYHTENDTASNLSIEQMTVITRALLGGLLELQTPQKDKSNAMVLVMSTVIVVVVAVALTLYLLGRRRAEG